MLDDFGDVALLVYRFPVFIGLAGFNLNCFVANRTSRKPHFGSEVRNAVHRDSLDSTCGKSVPHMRLCRSGSVQAVQIAPSGLSRAVLALPSSKRQAEITRSPRLCCGTRLSWLSVKWRSGVLR